MKIFINIASYRDPLLANTINDAYNNARYNAALVFGVVEQALPDEALKLDDNEIVYFIENDYIHKSGSPYILEEGFEIGADYITLYCHPDKFLPPSRGGNPYVGEDGGYNTKIYKSKSCFWLMTESTTMTFAAKVKTLKEDEDILRKWTSGIHPDDFKMFLDLRVKGKALLMPIPSYSTHGEVQWLAPFENWKEIIK